MCGIAGYVDLAGRPADPATVRRMTRPLADRGADGEGVVCRGGVGLGHRRLAIIDLVTGAQPMANENGTVWITFNGEIYNFQVLRAELQAHGATFRTTSDTEVILRAWERWGPECVHRLRGMFAFAILDECRRQVFLARDRVGIKPLVYAWDGQRLLFGSELKALLAAGLPRELDVHALAHSLVYGYIPAPRTIFGTARKLPPASWLLLSLGGGEPRVERYWSLRFVPDHGVTEQEWQERLRAALEEAVRIHMVSDVPIGAFLSGGVDSSTVVALMARASAAPVRTFSIGFEEDDYDELKYARQLAHRYGTEHYELVVKPDALDVLPRLAFGFDEPFADSSALPTYYVAKITREHVTVALSGDGGDENFAGYGRYARTAALSERLDTLPGTVLRAALGLGARVLRPGARGQGYAELLAAGPVGRYVKLVTLQSRHRALSLLMPDVCAALPPTPEACVVREAMAAAGSSDYVTQLQYADIQTYLPEDILTKVDRASMLPSLETRVPLLDHILMELAATIPSALKLRSGSGKHILKRAVGDLLPAEILGRKKMGFAVPLARWFRKELAVYVSDTLLGQRARQRGIVRPERVEWLLDQHRRGRDFSGQIWVLLMLEDWCRTWWDIAAAGERG